jgi:hypothetical protein
MAIRSGTEISGFSGYADRSFVDHATIVDDIVRTSTEGLVMTVHGVCSGDDEWPFPRYLSSLRNVAWWSSEEKGFVPTHLVQWEKLGRNQYNERRKECGWPVRSSI